VKTTLLITQMLLMSAVGAFAQADTLVDKRDGQMYSTVKIGTVYWMTENLRYESSLSKPLTDQDKSKSMLVDVEGRYYHFQEIDSVCPVGWDLPTIQDWFDYFSYLNVEQNVEMDFGEIDEPHHHFIRGYDGQIDLFKVGNVLNLKPIGRYEGSLFNISIDTPFADYWSKDDIEDYPGTTHIHLMNPWTTIHSHKHNMKPKQKEKIRRFMVRCVEHRN
jgi:uncharacterized protein (TIGR02145 family)